MATMNSIGRKGSLPKEDLDPIQIDLTDLIDVLPDGRKVWRGEVDWINKKGEKIHSTRIVTMPKGSAMPSSNFVDVLMKKLGVKK